MDSIFLLYLKSVRCRCSSIRRLFIDTFSFAIEVEYNPKQEEDDRYRTKMKEVERIEQLRQETGEQDQTENNNDTFGARMKLQIIQNLQLSIHNIHIVYEDRTTKLDHPFSFGITLNSMTFQVNRQSSSREDNHIISRPQITSGNQQL